MTHGEQAPFSGADYYNAIDMMEDHYCYKDTIPAVSDFSEVQMNSIYNVTESTQINASAEVFNCIPLLTEQLIGFLDVNNYCSSFERSGLTFYGPKDSSGVEGPDNYYLSHWSPKEETVSSGTFMNMEWQHAESAAFQVEAVNTNNSHEFQSTMKEEVDTSDVSPTSLRMSRNVRERSRETEYRRIYVVNQRVQALRELLPTMSKDKRNIQESTVQDAIDHIKYLQLQLKELTRSRLGGETSSDPLKFFEGYGHYHPHGEMLDEPLEEILGNLFEENSAAASKLLESKGLYMLPMASDALLCTQG